eukprot:COSAG01_NODE_27568_length_682_cov_1.077187_2_plen_50_part_01
MQALTPCSVDEEAAANGAHSYMLVERGAGYDTYLSRCHSPYKSINRSPMF